MDQPQKPDYSSKPGRFQNKRYGRNQGDTRGDGPGKNRPPKPKERLGVREVEALLSAQGAELEGLFQKADRTRYKERGGDVCLFGTIGFSNHSLGRCCCGGLQPAGEGVEEYRMAPAEILDLAKAIPADKIGTLLLESGEDPEFPIDMICQVVSEIKKATSLSVALSIGERSLPEYQKIKSAGADHLLLHQETINWILYGILNPGHKQEDRSAALHSVGDAGFPIWTGGLVGFSGQSLQGLAEDIISYAKIKAQFINVIPFTSRPGTGLSAAPGAGIGLMLKVIAATRIVNSSALISVPAALTYLRDNAWRLTLGVGANVLPVDLTPEQYRKGLPTSQACLQHGETIEMLVTRAEKEVKAAGRKLVPILADAGQ